MDFNDPREGREILEALGLRDNITIEQVRELDAEDELRTMRYKFRAPTVSELKNDNSLGLLEKRQVKQSQPSLYFCGNSLGLMPLDLRESVNAQLDHWQSKGVYGHFQEGAPNGGSPAWLDIDEQIKAPAARLVGARPDEVAIMQTLTVNLHLLMASFYHPTKERHKIILEGKAFPSDHYAVESHIRHHNLKPSDSMILIESPSKTTSLLPTDHILSIIDAHASTTALLLLPGIQYYTGQLFDMKTITTHAQSRGITVGWDLAHAVGNVPLKLHEWNVDFAAWCNYKYMNCGPGAIAGLFVHEKHTTVQLPGISSSNTNGHDSDPIIASYSSQPTYLPRLAGWWGSDKSTRFSGINTFVPLPGASGFQLSNPSALDLAAVRASLRVFSSTSVHALRQKSLRMTALLEHLLLSSKKPAKFEDREKVSSAANLSEPARKAEDQILEWPPYRLITPTSPQARGAQLSIQLRPGLLPVVMRELEESGIIVDERKPDVIRVAPAPLYNTFEEVLKFDEGFRMACMVAVTQVEMQPENLDEKGGTMVEGGQGGKGWSQIM